MTPCPPQSGETLECLEPPTTEYPDVNTPKLSSPPPTDATKSLPAESAVSSVSEPPPINEPEEDESEIDEQLSISIEFPPEAVEDVASKESFPKDDCDSLLAGPDDEVWIVFAPKKLQWETVVSGKVDLGSESRTKILFEDVRIKCDSQKYDKSRLLEMVTETGEKREMRAVGSTKITHDEV